MQHLYTFLEELKNNKHWMRVQEAESKVFAASRRQMDRVLEIQFAIERRAPGEKSELELTGLDTDTSTSPRQ